MKLVCAIALLILSVSFSGCGGATEAGSSESDKVVAAVMCLNDRAMDEGDFKTAFVDGAAPKNRADYFSSAIEVVSAPSLSGNEATISVKVSQGNSSSEGGKGLKATKIGNGEVTWKLKKEESGWKLTEAPLP